MSTSSASVRVTAWPRRAASRSPVWVTMRAMCERLPEGSTATSSPTLNAPAQTVPAKPRKSRFGRQTHCTGRRPLCVPSSPVSLITTFSRYASTEGPVYQGVRVEAAIRLSPVSADSGTACTLEMPS